MTTEIIIMIVGAVLILTALIDSLTRNASEMVNIKLRIPLGIIGVLLVIYGGFSYGNVNLTGQIEQPHLGNKATVKHPVERVQIVSPIDGDVVNCRILTTGVYPDNHDKDIWVVLKPTDYRYYPQSDYTNTSYKRNGEWQVITRFGGDQGEEYEIIVYETDAEASEFFSTTIKKWNEAGEYPGLEYNEIPKGAHEVDRINVSLSGNCRGVH